MEDKPGWLRLRKIKTHDERETSKNSIVGDVAYFYIGGELNHILGRSSLLSKTRTELNSRGENQLSYIPFGVNCWDFMTGLQSWNVWRKVINICPKSP